MIAIGNLGDMLFAVFTIMFMFIGYWFLFEKTGEAGWKALIPCYAEYMKHKIVKKEKLFWIKLCLVGLMGMTSAILIDSMIVEVWGFRFMRNTMNFTSALFSILLMVEFALFIVTDLKKAMATAKMFGKSSAYGLGLAFLEPIFIMILAFDDNAKIEKEPEVKEEKENVTNPFDILVVEEAESNDEPIIDEKENFCD